MGLSISKNSETQYTDPFITALEDIPGGGTIHTGDLKAATEEIKAGAVVGGPDSDGIYRLCKSAEVYADSEAAAIQVLKAHEFKAGDFLSNGNNSSVINSITTTEDDYDTITVESGFTVLDGDYLYESTSEGTEADDVEQLYTPVGFLRDNVDVITYSTTGSSTLANVSGGIVIRGSVNESILPFVVPDVTKTALTARIYFD